MGLFDKAKDAFETHRDKIDPSTVSEGIERAGDFIDSKTGGKYADKIDQAQEFAHDKADDFLGTDETAPSATETVPPAADPAQPGSQPPTTPAPPVP